ncbi:MAG TPA: hypothetical protein VFQ87_03290 [Bradyrhizobium sp.]|nr:hypothetical protein [Bradyrhizobium sp.]
MTRSKYSRGGGSAVRLVYLPANAAWVFLFGDSMIRLEDARSRFFESRSAAVAHARRLGLTVDRRGRVHVTSTKGVN